MALAMAMAMAMALALADGFIETLETKFDIMIL